MTPASEPHAVRPRSAPLAGPSHRYAELPPHESEVLCLSTAHTIGAKAHLSAIYILVTSPRPKLGNCDPLQNSTIQLQRSIEASDCFHNSK